MNGFYRSCHCLVLCALLAVMCVLTASRVMAAPITWTGKASMPTSRSRAASGVVNGKIFVLGGDSAGSTAVEMYDPAKDTWQSWPPLSQPVFAPCQVTFGDTIYMVGMNSSQVIAYRTFIHSGGPNPLPVPPPYGFSEVVGSLNTSRSSRAQAALVNKKMYIVGTGPNMDQIEEFDLTTFTSVTKNTRLPAGRDLPMVTAFEGRIYIMGGINGGVATTTIWQYDPVSDSIFETGSIPSPMAGNMVATWGGKIYIAGAATNGAAPPAWDGTLWEYDVRGSFWNSYDAVPTSRYAAAVQIWNGTLYVIGGDSGGSMPTSLATNEAALLPSGSPRWTVRDTNTPPVVHPSIATVNGTIFMLGGRTSINFNGQRDVYSFDPAAPAPAWQRMPDLASPILAAPAAVHGQKIYLAGGESLSGSPTADIQFYDTATTPYTSGVAASLRYPRAKAGAAIVNDRLYVIGGGTTAIEEFDLTTTPITRTERVDNLPEALYQPTTVAANGRIYIMGGTVAAGPAANTVTDVCLVYDPWGPPGAFTPCAPLPVALDENEGAALIDGKIYLVGGGTNGLYSPDTTSAVQKYDPASDTWEVSDTMTASRRDHGIAYTNGHIYVMGGWLNGGGYWANTTEEYIVPFIWRVNSYSSDAVDWPGSLHGTVPTGSYLLIGGTYYYVRASYSGSWNGPGFNMAVLQQCDQFSGEPLYDPMNPGVPLPPDLAGSIFQSIDLISFWQPRTRPAWTVSSFDPASPAGIDWPAGAHGPVTPGTYLQVGTTVYYVMASGTGSWRGSDYIYAYLYNCDQTTGQVIDYGANMTGSVGATIATYLFPPQISVSPQSFDFGTTTFPFISGAQMFSIGNFGGAPLVVNSIGITGVDAGHFSISSYDTCGSAPTLAPGSSCSIFIIYAPQDTGARNAMLQVASNDPNMPTATVPLSGNSALVPLNLSFAGTGSGTVSFSNGDSCTGSCNRSFSATTTLTLTANAVPGAQFSGWAGCGSVTGNQCTVSMMSAQNVTATFDLLPPPAEVWSTKVPMPIGLSRAFSAVVNGSIYILGGSPSTPLVQRYNPQSDIWTEQSPLPTPLFGGATAAQGQIIYLAGGFDAAMTFQNAILAYNTMTGTTQQVGSLVTPRARVNGTILNNRLYVVGGSNALSSIEEFDLGTGSSSTIATLPEPTELAAVMGNLNDLYIFGGGADNTKSWRFDTVSKTFYPLASSPVSVKARSVTFDSGRALLVDTWGFNNVNNVLEYSFTLDSWRIVTTVPTLRNVPMVEAVDGVIHVMGGDSATGTINEAWRFGTPPVLSHTVTPVASPNGSISPAMPQTVTDGATITFTVQPAAGYRIGSVSGCGGTLTGSTFTTGAITADCTVTASFDPFNPADLCKSVDMVWYIGASEIRRDLNCASGQQSASGYCYSFATDACPGSRCMVGNTISPACYSDTECAATCGGTCVKIPAMSQTCSSSSSTYTVTPIAGANGSIGPATPQTVNAGATVSFTVTPYPGYHVGSVTGCGGTLSGNTYTTGPVTAACTVNALFAIDGTGDSCTTVDMVWYSEGLEVRRDYNCASGQQSASGYCFSYQTDSCPGYRCVANNEITPACYSLAECTAACGGQCVEIQAKKSSCTTTPTAYPLSVTLTGAGTGTVHSTPAPDIACFTGVCTQSYAMDTVVTLTATPASGYAFVGWGNDCSGTGQCQVTMTGGKVVKAIFTASGDTTPPTVGTFTMPSSSDSLNVPVNSFTASDNVAVTGYAITESSAPPAATASMWNSAPPGSFTFLAPGNCYAYAWVKDATGNVSAAKIATVSITIPNPVDTQAPLITSFIIEASSTLTVPVSLAVTDNVGVTGYIVSESSTAPATSDPRWSSTPPSGYTFATYGGKTLYAWARDAAGNISTGVIATTTVLDPALALNTLITGWPGSPMPYSPSVFTFIASRTSAGFECSLDNQGYFPCASPMSFGSLANGSHIFSVRAKDGGIADDTPATFTWTVQVPLVQVLLNTYPSVLDAYQATADGASLKIKGIEFREDLVFDRPVAVNLQGGYDAAYLNTDGTSIIHGSIAISQGTVTIDNITII